MRAGRTSTDPEIAFRQMSRYDVELLDTMWNLLRRTPVAKP